MASLVKATARIEEPLAWKGGMLAELMKAGGAPLDCDGYRGIFVTDVAGKQLHGWYRRCLMPSYRTLTRPTQFGDVEHMGTVFCSHMARAYWDWLAAATRSGFELFVDIIGAFDAVIRRYIADTRCDDYRVLQVLIDLQLPPAYLHEFVDAVRREETNVLRDAGVSEHLRALITHPRLHVARGPGLRRDHDGRGGL